MVVSAWPPDDVVVVAAPAPDADVEVDVDVDVDVAGWAVVEVVVDVAEVEGSSATEAVVDPVRPSIEEPARPWASDCPGAATRPSGFWVGRGVRCAPAFGAAAGVHSSRFRPVAFPPPFSLAGPHVGLAVGPCAGVGVGTASGAACAGDGVGTWAGTVTVPPPGEATWETSPRMGPRAANATAEAASTSPSAMNTAEACTDDPGCATGPRSGAPGSVADLSGERQSRQYRSPDPLAVPQKMQWRGAPIALDSLRYLVRHDARSGGAVQ